MTDLSKRQLDAFDNPAKAACREGNLRDLREATYLLWAGPAPAKRRATEGTENTEKDQGPGLALYVLSFLGNLCDLCGFC